MAYGNHVYKPARPAKPAGQILQKALPGRRAGWLDPGSQFWKIWPAFLAARAGFPPYIFLFIYSMLQYIANYVHVYIYIYTYIFISIHPHTFWAYFLYMVQTSKIENVYTICIIRIYVYIHIYIYIYIYIFIYCCLLSNRRLP